MSLLTFVCYGREEILKCRSLRVLSLFLCFSVSLSLQIEGENRRERNTESERLKEEEEDLATTKDRAAKVSFCVYFRVFFFLFCFFLFWRINFFSSKNFCVLLTRHLTRETEEKTRDDMCVSR